jgi:metal-responsive CopG/Arc/MetJ family transcriptional regulator
MTVYNFHFPDDLITELRNLSKETGAPVSELLRRAAREYLEKRKQKNEKEKS